jgi:hypothetical protein
MLARCMSRWRKSKHFAPDVTELLFVPDIGWQQLEGRVTLQQLHPSCLDLHTSFEPDSHLSHYIQPHLNEPFT